MRLSLILIWGLQAFTANAEILHFGRSENSNSVLQREPNDWASLDDFWRQAQAYPRDMARKYKPSSALFDSKENGHRIRLQNPTKPISKILITQTDDPQSMAWAKDLVAKVASIDPQIEVFVLSINDYKGYRPIWEKFSEADPKDEDTHMRDMRLQISAYKGGKLVRASEPFQRRFLRPSNWARDLIHVFDISGAKDTQKGLVQVLQKDIMSPIYDELKNSGYVSASSPTHFFIDGKSLEEAEPNESDFGGNLVPLTENIAIVGDGMSFALKTAMTKRGLKLIEVHVDTPVGHADEYFSVVPDKHSSCGFAVLYAQPDQRVASLEKNGLNAKITKATQEALPKIRQVTKCEGLRMFPIPMAFETQKNGEMLAVGGNPLNSLNFPSESDVRMLMAKPDNSAYQTLLEARYAEISEQLGLKLTPEWINADYLNKNSGSVHCATQELRK